MSLQLLGITVLWTFLYGYLIVASVDFGAGFFAYYGKITKKDHVINHIISRYLSPVWEVTNVFFVFFFVGLIGFFPDTAYYYGTALLIPGSIALILLALRGSFYAFGNYGAKKGNSFYLFLYGATGLLIPASLSTALTISEGGFLEKKGDSVEFLAMKLFASPYSWSVVLLAIVSVLFISASFLTYYADRANDVDARNVLRKFALFWSIPCILASLLVFTALKGHNARHFSNALDIWWMFGLSFLCFLVATIFIYRKKWFGWAFILVMLQFFFAFFGYGASHLPYILDPFITIHTAVTNDAMGTALVIAFIAGLFLLVPSLGLLMKLFLFDADYVRGKK
ncbi:cytochrome d ubiquinol oxidase subunit II [Bacillus sp. FJAT-27245]|uniref:cytochrome d ubiquinol oxidase subunit II n=1 Tax=Bacillus sp. FJAT-27245 TaxID=1684144 RepID=UPI0006A7EC6B|nr:cytochrome d ubiquinol oxidase subunit II [Bacillus sp. FJAT-27245]